MLGGNGLGLVLVLGNVLGGVLVGNVLGLLRIGLAKSK